MKRPSVAESLSEIQGNVLRGYKGLPRGKLLLVRVEDLDGGRAWLRELLRGIEIGGTARPITTEGTRKPEELALNVAFTFAGLGAFDVPEELLAAFPEDFRDGMKKRADRLGDGVAGDPLRYWDGSPATGAAGHVLVVVRARDNDTRHRATEALERRIDGDRSLELVDQETGDPVDEGSAGDRFAPEHFGFADGISQPTIEGTLTSDDTEARTVGRWEGMPDGNGGWRGVRTGEFILGHEDEDGAYAAPAIRFGANGSFMVFRKLQQDVAAFEDAVAENARRMLVAAGSAPTAEALRGAAEQVAAKIMGRWQGGAPLTLFPHGPPVGHGAASNDFGYREDDLGFGCPLGAHVRRANPRDALVGGVERVRRHRIVRRGLPYGPPATETAEDGSSRGLLFICFNASIARQFEVVQSWCLDGNLFDVPDESDFILGPTEEPSSTMTVQGKRPHFLVRDRPLVETKGGGYFFYPSMTALQALASGSFDGLGERIAPIRRPRRR